MTQKAALIQPISDVPAVFWLGAFNTYLFPGLLTTMSIASGYQTHHLTYIQPHLT